MQLLSIIRSLVWKLLTQLFIKNLLLLLEEKVLILLKSKTESDFFWNSAFTLVRIRLIYVIFVLFLRVSLQNFSNMFNLMKIGEKFTDFAVLLLIRNFIWKIYDPF